MSESKLSSMVSAGWHVGGESKSESFDTGGTDNIFAIHDDLDSYLAGFDLSYKDGRRVCQFSSSVSSVVSTDTHLFASSLAGELISWEYNDEGTGFSGEPDRYSMLNADDHSFAMSCMDIVENRFVVAGGLGGHTAIWSAASARCQASWFDHSKKVAAVCGVDGNLMSVGHDGYFRVRDVEYGVISHSYTACQCPLSSLAVEGPDPNKVFIGGWDGQVKLLDLRQKSCALVIKAKKHGQSPVRALALTEARPPPPRKKPKKGGGFVLIPVQAEYASTVVAAHGVGHISSWDMRMKSAVVSEYTGHQDVVNHLHVDGPWMYSAGDDSTVRIFDLYSGTLLETLCGHGNGIRSFALTQHSLFTGSFDQTCRSYSREQIEDAVALKIERADTAKEQAIMAFEKAQRKRTKKRRGKRGKGKGKSSKGRSKKSRSRR